MTPYKTEAPEGKELGSGYMKSEVLTKANITGTRSYSDETGDGAGTESYG
jgi:hypothetical protein